MAINNKKANKLPLQAEDLAKKYWRQALSAVIVLAVLAGVGVWYIKVYTSASNVFNAMVSNNLTLNSVTREVSQPVCLSSSGSSANVIQITYFPKLEAHCITRITDNSSSPPATIVAETIGLRDNDYEHYAYIQKPGKPNANFDKVYKLWLKNGVDASSQKLLIKSLFNPVLFGHVAEPTRRQVVTQLRQAYSVDYKRLQKSHFSGRLTYGYNVNINLAKFSKAWNTYAAYSGYGKDYLIKDGTYTPDSRLAINIQVDALSRQVKSVNFQGVSEVYASYGVGSPAGVPAKTSSPAELQKALNQVK